MAGPLLLSTQLPLSPHLGTLGTSWFYLCPWKPWVAWGSKVYRVLSCWTTVLVSVLQRNSQWEIYTYIKGDSLQGIGSHDLLSASWRLRKASGVIQLRLKTWEPWCKPKSKRRIRCGEGSQFKQWGRKKKEGEDYSFLHFLFYSGPQEIRWWPPTLGRMIYFTESADSNADLIWKHRTDTSEVIFNVGSPWPAKLT